MEYCVGVADQIKHRGAGQRSRYQLTKDRAQFELLENQYRYHNRTQKNYCCPQCAHFFLFTLHLINRV